MTSDEEKIVPKIKVLMIKTCALVSYQPVMF